MRLWFTRTINKNLDLLRKCMKIGYICQMPSKMYILAEIILSIIYTELVEMKQVAWTTFSSYAFRSHFDIINKTHPQSRIP